MKKETYEYFAEKIRRHPWGVPVIEAAGRGIVCTSAAFYLGTLLELCVKREWLPAIVLWIVPMAAFAAVSIFRIKYNKMRPYEFYDMQPLIKKETKGKSFPSRHTFSIFVIGVSLLFFHPFLGGLACLMGVCLAVLRVVTGVHFPKDVLAGTVLGVLGGALTGFVLHLL